MNDPITEAALLQNRRQMLGRTGAGVGAMALASLLGESASAKEKAAVGGLKSLPHFAAKAKRVIYLLQSGAPSQMELYDYKPTLAKLHGSNLPASVRDGQRLTGMTSRQRTLPVVNPPFKFRQHGKSGTWISDLLPHTAKVVDQICMIKSMHTQAINHDPAVTFFQSGFQQPGRPSIGAWFSYGLGSENQDLPAYVVLLSKNTFYQAQPLYARVWGSGFLPSNHQGVKFRSQGDPVLYLTDPSGAGKKERRVLLDSIAAMNELRKKQLGDPEISTRIAQYEMSYRMQTSVPELADVSDEPESTFKLYGEDARIPGTHAANCLLARRLAERDVRFIQLFHRGWDHHSNLAKHIPKLCKETDQGSAALVQDLKQRGMLDDTLVLWGGEFGRTVYSQGGIGNYGRDHHPRCFTVWMAGGGVKGGISHGQTDEFCYNIAKDPVHVHDFHATIMHCMGIDHERFTYRFQGRDYRLTDIHGKVVKEILA
jgi:hypothetical protein